MLATDGPCSRHLWTNEGSQTMPVELKELNDGGLLEIHLTGKLVKEDYRLRNGVVAAVG